MSDSSSDSSDSSMSKFSSTYEQESARTKQEPATVASRAVEFWALLESKGGYYRCPEWMKLAELALVVVTGSGRD
eukprot:102039-Pelagomonas_calceolata.AAC.5